MGRELLFKDFACDDYLIWQSHDKKTLKRINDLIKDIRRNPYLGIGKPEPLRGDKRGYWSRRIDEANRIVYKIIDNQVVIVQYKGHYAD